MASQSPFGVVPGHDIVRTGSRALLENLGGNTIRAAIWAPQIESQCARFALQSGHRKLNLNAHRHIVQTMKPLWYVLPEVFPLPDGAEDLAVDFHMDARARLAQSISWGPMASS